jgi:hypothetical protein
MLRGLIGIAVGLLTAAVFFQASSSLLLLATDGTPLGADSRNTTFGELVGYLAVGIAAAVIAYVGFTAPTSQWPLWWAVIVTALVPPCVWVGGRGIGFAARDRSS